jgi:DNA invertase Pin-like site-specific DNA recombinase
MSNIIAALRINQYNQAYIQTQKELIDTYVSKHNTQITQSIELEVHLPNQEENVIHALKNLPSFATLIVADLNVLGRTSELILEILRYLLKRKIRVICVKQNLDLIDDEDMLTQMILGVINMTINLDKELMSLRTKEALNAKKMKGVHLGKPKGTIQKSKFDKQRDKIEELLSVGLSVRKIAKLLGYSNHIGLNNYVKKRNIRTQIKTVDLSQEEESKIAS